MALHLLDRFTNAARWRIGLHGAEDLTWPEIQDVLREAYRQEGALPVPVRVMAPFTCSFVGSQDDGIRPGGPQDACFYCGQKIGERHLFACVTQVVPRTYRVLLDGIDIGSWSTDDPVSWDVRMRDFHKNEASWCANNVTHVGRLAIAIALPSTETACLCGRLAFEPVADEPEYEEAR